ncbi:hypothetical protein O181_002284 [Austropuccinia psidii MF-1]|uniref:Uncharacterized protein n=1 Tax=Austropuccinia psidii MF-1 TaxID=1389203 RepID=A0A9Q3BC03_9BASI|nr:hypothetical protein [Austropuccinia psidii MF-1]
MKAFPSGNELRDPKQADGNNSGKLAQFHLVLIFPLPHLGHHLMITSLLDQSEVIIQPMKDGNGKRTFEFGPIVTMVFKRQKQNQPNLLQQDCLVPSLPCKQTLWNLLPGPSGKQWLEDLFCCEQPKIPLLILTLNSIELTLSPFVEPSQPNGSPAPGPSQPSEPQEDTLTCDPEP